jgi:hypothetical protein
MKKIFGALAVAALLASCSVLDQKFVIQDGSTGKDDPIGLKGKAVTVSLLKAGNVQLQATSNTLTSNPFADFNFPDTSPAVLKSLTFRVSLADSYKDSQGTTVQNYATLTGGTCPASFKISGLTGSVKLSDSSNTTGVTQDLKITPAEITFTKVGTGTVSPCNYSFPSSSMELTLSGDKLATTKTILSNGTQGNVAALTLNYTQDPATGVGGSFAIGVGGGTAEVIAGI